MATPWSFLSSQATSSTKVHPPPGVKALNDSVYELYKPTNGPIDMDVLFFHGLQPDNLEEAYWKAFVAADEPTLIWPKEWLPLQLKNARILSVTYTERFDMFIQGENLVEDIITEANVGHNRHVFLVGHSIGGLIIKQFINSTFRKKGLADNLADVARFDMFLRNLKGVFYYSTPHGGCEDEIEPMAKEVVGNSPLLELLKPSDKGRARMNLEFEQYLHKLPTAGLVESEPTTCKKFSGTVVTDASARRDPNIYTFSPSNHFTVCKARSDADPTVIMKLVRFINDAKKYNPKVHGQGEDLT